MHWKSQANGGVVSSGELMQTRKALMAAGAFILAVVPIVAQTQSELYGSDLGDPWDNLKLNSKTRVKLSFRNASVDNVIAFIEQASNITLVKDPTLTGPITVTTSAPVSLAEAFYVFDSVLRLRGFQISRQRKLLVIKALPKTTARTGPGGMPGTGMMGGPGGTGGPGAGQNQVQFYRLTYASASQVAKAINDLFQSTSTVSIGGRFGGGPGGNGPGGNGPGGGGPGGGPGGGGPGGFGGPGGADQAAAFGTAAQSSQGASTSGAHAAAEEFSNMVIVYASQSLQSQVAALIKEIDKKQTSAIQSKTFKLHFASASDLATTIQNVLIANANKGRGASSTTTTQQGFGPFGGFGQGNTQQNQNLAVADSRTNSIIVSGTEDQLVLADKVINDLDQKMPFVTTTYVYQLKSARSDTVANLLTAAFGQRTGSSSRTNTTITPTNNSFTNSSTSTSTRSTAPGGSVDNSQGLALNLQDPNASSGELLTSVGVTQGFGGGMMGMFGGQSSNSSRTSTSSTVSNGQGIGYDSTGHVIGVHDLTGQVTAISDPNTNSVIIVTTPDNLELVKNVIDQLDRIPEQVMIQTVIVEASLDKTSQFGVEYAFAQKVKGVSTSIGQNFGLQSTSPALQGLSYTLSGGDVSAFFNMLQTDTKYQVLSTPRIFTSNNMEAQINISQSIPYVVSTVQSTTGTYSYNYAFQNVGIVLTVTPHITKEGYVTMDVTQTANDLQGYTSFNAPIVNQREAQTTVSAKDGETIVLGGMIRNQVSATVNKLPLLGDLPVLGNLFRNTSKSNQKTELLVFLTPKVVRDPAEAKRLKDETEKQVNADLTNLLKNQAKPEVKNKPKE